MGRYIVGDINRKLWFAVQSSNAADRFGVTGCEPNYIEYYFNKEDNRLFPPKRIPWMGWTINFANWKSIGAFVLLFGIILLLLWNKKSH